jgi:MFS family permease
MAQRLTAPTVGPVLRPSAFAPFRVSRFRFQWPADLLTSCAFEMETLILGWYVLVESGSVLLLTLFGSLLYAGTLVAPVFGVIGDRIGQRNLLCFMRGFYTLLAATLMAIAFAGLLTPFAVLVIAGLMGIVRPSDLGVRGALVADIMPAALLLGAMGISRTTSDAARVAGALSGAGLFAAYGMGAAYIVVASFYALGLLLTLCIRDGPKQPQVSVPVDAAAQHASAWRDLIEGIAYVWTRPQLLAAMLMAFLANLTAFPLSNGLLPYVAREIYRVDQTGLGYLVAGWASGALLGSLAVSVNGGIRPARMMIISAFAWYAALLVFAHMQTATAGIAVLALAGFAQSYCMVALAVLLLRITEQKFRGRVMGVRMLAIYSLPLGLLAAGTLIDHIGFRATASLYATVGLMLTLLIALNWRADLWQAGTPASAR